jgi:RNA polymerase sigma factor (sigma-70 family)
MAGKFYTILSDEDIEDLTHDAYLRVMENRDKADLNKNINGWIYRICQDCVNGYTADKGRRKGWITAIDEGYDDDEYCYSADCMSELADFSNSADRPMECREFEKRFWNGVGKLTPEYRDVAMMLLDETPYSEMAQARGCSEEALRVRIFRTRKALLKMGIAA